MLMLDKARDLNGETGDVRSLIGFMMGAFNAGLKAKTTGISLPYCLLR